MHFIYTNICSESSGIAAMMAHYKSDRKRTMQSAKNPPMAFKNRRENLNRSRRTTVRLTVNTDKQWCLIYIRKRITETTY